MPLSQTQADKLADAFYSHWDLPRLVEFADLLDVKLNNLAPDGTLKTRARRFISAMTSSQPPRDREMLERLLIEGNAGLKRVAEDLLKPAFISTQGDDPYHAIALGRAAFLDRQDLREELPEFTDPGSDTTRVLIVNGKEPCGKSYTWRFLQHLSLNVVGAEFHRMRLQESNPTTRAFFEAVGRRLGLSLAGTDFPEAADDPQEEKTLPYIAWLDGQVGTLMEPHWLIIDDLNHQEVKKPAREAAYALARFAEEKKGNLWVALLGYNEAITDSELDYIAGDEAAFPSPSSVAQYFECLSAVSPQPLTSEEAREWADLLFPAQATIDKEVMSNLKKKIEKMGEKFKRGQRP